MSDELRIVVGEDQVLLREGLVRLLTDAGFRVVGQAGDAESLVEAVREHRPDVAIIDVQMPPDHTDDGVRAALVIRRSSLRWGCSCSRSSSRSATPSS